MYSLSNRSTGHHGTTRHRWRRRGQSRRVSRWQTDRTEATRRAHVMRIDERSEGVSGSVRLACAKLGLQLLQLLLQLLHFLRAVLEKTRLPCNIRLQLFNADRRLRQLRVIQLNNRHLVVLLRKQRLC